MHRKQSGHLPAQAFPQKHCSMTQIRITGIRWTEQQPSGVQLPHQTCLVTLQNLAKGTAEYDNPPCFVYAKSGKNIRV